MKTNTVGWFEIYVDDIKRAVEFYESVFDRKLELLTNPAEDQMDVEMWSFPGDMSSYGANGALVKMPNFGAGNNSVLVYFSCEDCSTEEKRVSKFGGKVEKSKFAIGEYGFVSLVYDSEGNMIGLHSLN